MSEDEKDPTPKSTDVDDPRESDGDSALALASAEESLAASDDDSLGGEEAQLEGEVELDDPVAGHVGVEKYVHAAFFAAAILAAFLGGKMLLSLWNNLAEHPDAVRTLPFLIEYTEDERGSLTLIIGAVLGVFLILRYYRRPTVRSWATSVAGELARVTWPSKETVTNGTIVVLVAGAIATVYIALLDRLWGYLTNLVYGA